MPDSEPRPPQGPRSDDEGRVPFFGTWPRIYAAVIVTAIVVMSLLAVFSRWPF